MKKIILIMAVLFPVVLFAQKNAQWRGENRDGVYNETGLLKVWPTGGPQLLWKYEGMGNSFAAVSIANEKIYLTGLEDDNLMLYILDMSGKLITKKQIGKEWTTNHTGTRCTVVVNEGKLYIGNSLGQVFCLDESTLNQIWKKDMTTDFDGKNVMWGMVESPLIVGEKIFLTPGGTKNNMVALNKNTGALIWSSAGEGTTSSYSSPIHISDQSVPMVVTATLKHVLAFNANTGEKLWSHPQTNDRNIHPNSPIYSDGMVFAITGYRGGAQLLRLKNGGKAVEQVWKNPEMDNQMGGAIRVGDYVYASGHNNQYFFCVDWKTGATKYKAPEIGPCNVIFADGMLYCYTERGDMCLVKPNPDKFEMVSSFKVTLGTREHWTHPVIHNGILYLRHGDTLMAYMLK